MKKTILFIVLFFLCCVSFAEYSYYESFNGIQGTIPFNWSSKENHRHNYPTETRLAVFANGVTLKGGMAASGWGEVFSSVIETDVSQYKYLQIEVSRITPGACWMVGIGTFEHGDDWSYPMSYCALTPDSTVVTSTGYFCFRLKKRFKNIGINRFVIVLSIGFEKVVVPVFGNEVDVVSVCLSNNQNQEKEKK